MVREAASAGGAQTGLTPDVGWPGALKRRRARPRHTLDVTSDDRVRRRRSGLGERVAALRTRMKGMTVLDGTGNEIERNFERTWATSVATRASRGAWPTSRRYHIALKARSSTKVSTRSPFMRNRAFWLPSKGMQQHLRHCRLDGSLCPTQDHPFFFTFAADSFRWSAATCSNAACRRAMTLSWPSGRGVSRWMWRNSSAKALQSGWPPSSINC
jgi:hypothetical protein